MAADPYLALIADLYALEPPIFIFGGYAEDALLHGQVNRSHADLDVLVVRTELEQRLSQFALLGFERFQIYHDIAPDKPLVLNSERNGLHLEIGIMDRDASGRTYFEVRSQPWDQVCRIYLPDDAFSYPPVKLGGTSVRTLSPLALYQIRAGLAAVNAFGDFRPTDAPAQTLLKARFFPDADESQLLPEIR